MYHHDDENNPQCHKKSQSLKTPKNIESNKIQTTHSWQSQEQPPFNNQNSIWRNRRIGHSSKKNEEEMIKFPTIDVITLSDSTQNSPIKVFTSNNKYDFMITSPESPDTPINFSSTISIPKIDKALRKIQKLNATPTSNNSPIENNAVPFGITQTEQAPSNNTKTSDSAIDISLTSSPKSETSKNQSMEDEPEGAQDHDPNEEHFAASTSPGKSSISDIKPGDFYD